MGDETMSTRKGEIQLRTANVVDIIEREGRDHVQCVRIVTRSRAWLLCFDETETPNETVQRSEWVTAIRPVTLLYEKKMQRPNVYVVNSRNTQIKSMLLRP